jgi:hypothetical protein
VDQKFAALVERLHPAYLTMMARAPITGGAMPDYGSDGTMAKRGIYLFTENCNHLYVGRSNRLWERYRNHWGPTKTERQSAFAFKLAREATGSMKATYKKGAVSRKELVLDSTFNEAFTAAKKRIRAMEYRWVEETDPTRQCLLEIYAAIVLATPYNDFDTH